MNKMTINYLLLIMILWFVACSPAISPENVNIIATNPSTTTVPTIIPSVTPSVNETSNITPIPTETNPPTIVLTPTNLPNIQLTTKCPTLIDENKLALWGNGSILFNSGKIQRDTFNDIEVDNSGIWAISSNTLAPQLIYDAKSVWVSPSGLTLLSFDRAENTQLPQLTFYDLNSKEFTSVALPTDTIGFAPEWLPDGRVRTAFTVSKILGVGEAWDVFIADPNTQTVERLTQELKLPEYEFYEYDAERGIPTGFISLDPTHQRVLYTAGQGQKHEVRLLDMSTGELLWKSPSNSLINTFPQWSNDGQSVLFELTAVREDIPAETNKDWNITFAWSKLVHLSWDGQEKELPFQPYPGLLDQQLNNFSRSLDNRFIFYSMTNYSTGASHGYVVDTEIGAIGEICDSKSLLVAEGPNKNMNGYWLPNNQFVYRSLIEKDGQLTHSLRVLDISTWTTQIIFEAQPGYGVNILGWTPIEFTE